MRTLDEITTAVRRNEPVTVDEMRLAIVAYDVLMAKFEIEKYPKLLHEYFVAGDSVPGEYVGDANHPDDADAVAWHKNNIKVVDTP